LDKSGRNVRLLEISEPGEKLSALQIIQVILGSISFFFKNDIEIGLIMIFVLEEQKQIIQ
jgi:hypothetical protein